MDGIMVSAATGVMNSLLDKLTTLQGDEYKLQKGIKCDITFLKDELSIMNALLEKLANTEVLDPPQQDWRNQVREMAYDIEDCIDKYMHQLHHEPKKPSGIMGFFLSFIEKVKKLEARHEIVEQIQEIKARVIEASHRRKRYKPDVADSSGSTNVVPIDPRLPALYAEASDLVGIDVPRDELIKLVNDGEEQLKVVAIVGFGGLGKTTLANQIYQMVGEQFDCQAFLSVSQKPDTRKILQNILSQINKQCYTSTEPGDEEQLINALRDFLKDKRYFIVIDDIWSTQAWRFIKCALLENTCGSRILVTTRIANVAKSCCFPRHNLVYELGPLSEADSKRLFFRRIFGSKDIYPLQLKEVSTEIIRKCGGLPLAIITMSSLLTTKSPAREEWVTVLNSIGSGLEKNSDVMEMKKILSLSYNDLPLQLRTCLLYLSMFPEDYEIERDRLVNRWIAEGFVKVDGGRNLREEGECYFNELINRSMVQPVNMRHDGQARACRVHDMILDLIISKAVEENFITFTSDKTHMLVSQNKILRLSLDYRGQENEIAMSSMVTTHVRSLGIFVCSVQMPPILDWHALRVLDIESSEKLENCDLRNVGRLFQLRYLRIGARGITNLPEQIGELQHLETLDLHRTEIRELPASVVKLRRLKSLRANRVKLPDRMGSMQALGELSGVNVCKSSISSLQELGSLTKLRTLELYWCISDSRSDKMMYADILASSLCKLFSSNLRCLNVPTNAFSSADIPLDSLSPPPHLLRELHISGCCFKAIPECMASQSNLTRLSIRVNQVTQETLQILGDLPALLRLSISGACDSQERLTVCNNRFRCVKFFHFGYLKLMFEAGAMPKLKELWIHIRAREVQSTCGDLGLGIHHLSTLSRLSVNIDCEGARVEEVEALEAAITNAASPAQPSFYRWSMPGGRGPRGGGHEAA